MMYTLRNEIFMAHRAAVNTGRHRAVNCREVLNVIQPVEKLDLAYRKEARQVEEKSVRTPTWKLY